MFNQILRGEAGAGGRDGRTERRRRRLLDELAAGAARGGKRALKPIDVLGRVQELLALGEPLAAIRKACPRPRPIEATPEVIEGIRRIHQAYAFPAEAYAFVGLDEGALRRAGVLPDEKPALRATRPPSRPAAGSARTRSRRGAA
jgi:hypothetical protein